MTKFDDLEQIVEYKFTIRSLPLRLSKKITKYWLLPKVANCKKILCKNKPTGTKNHELNALKQNKAK